MTEKKIGIESILKQLEKIVTQMEEENLNLEDTLKSYENGISLVKEAQESLNKIEEKIQILSENNELNNLDLDE
ncbi:MAG: exodeoxyribonuclease VII small subunit [Methylophilaceae bacterium]|jgi:exodeoxyribonuclease VII small subunit|nr:exodeoxyribonuclease VII small subunit [Methylophilaceae bacterium]